MTARKTYYKIYAVSELPVAMVNFAYKDKDDIIQLGACTLVDFKDGHEVNIKKMEKIERRKGFMFWMNSDEGIDFINTHMKEMSAFIAKTVLNQK